jgi:hypothetical protein
MPQRSNGYKLNLPKDIPTALFWTVTIHDFVTGWTGPLATTPTPQICLLSPPHFPLPKTPGGMIVVRNGSEAGNVAWLRKQRLCLAGAGKVA